MSHRGPPAASPLSRSGPPAMVILDPWRSSFACAAHMCARASLASRVATCSLPRSVLSVCSCSTHKRPGRLPSARSPGRRLGTPPASTAAATAPLAFCAALLLRARAHPANHVMLEPPQQPIPSAASIARTRVSIRMRHAKPQRRPVAPPAQADALSSALAPRRML
jgi:hypothetical protein